MNAGLANELSFEFCPTQDIVQLGRTNFLDSILVCRTFVEQIVQSKCRSIRFQSTSFNLIIPLARIYGATKGPLESFSDILNESLKTVGLLSRDVCSSYFIDLGILILTSTRSVREPLLKMGDKEQELFKRNIENYGKMIDEQIKLRLVYVKHINGNSE